MTRLTHERSRTVTIAPATRAAVRRALAVWYETARRDLPWRHTKDPYRIWVSEVMLQQTQVKTVVPYYHRFLEKFPNAARLAQADTQAVLKLWEGLGYYSRARNLHRAARIVVETLAGHVPSEWTVIRQLPGVGDYIAAAVLSIAFSKPFAVVDGNVKRVLARLFLISTPVNAAAGHKWFQAVADQLLDAENPGRHNQALMELGAEVCTPRRPLCSRCPLSRHCKALQSRVMDQYPRRVERRAVGRQRWVAGVVVKRGRLLLTQRPGEGLLAGLWEFPGGVVKDGDDPAKTCVDRIQETTGVKTAVKRHVVTVHHAYTHFKLHLEVYLCAYRNGRIRLDGPAACEWVHLDQLVHFPLHKAVHKVLPALQRIIEG